MVEKLTVIAGDDCFMSTMVRERIGAWEKERAEPFGPEASAFMDYYKGRLCDGRDAAHPMAFGLTFLTSMDDVEKGMDQMARKPLPSIIARPKAAAKLLMLDAYLDMLETLLDADALALVMRGLAPMIANRMLPSELGGLETAKSEQEWTVACDTVLKRRGGRYPDDWFINVMAGGVMARFQARLGSAKLTEEERSK